MSWQSKWDHWKKHAQDDALRAEALTMGEAQARECFGRDLEFGTGGMRGVLGAGTNRINVYTIRKATQGFAEYIRAAGPGAVRRGVAIAHDNRRMSADFTMEAAGVLAANGIRAYVFDSLRPTPELSFAVRKLGCFGGIMITASHNPPQYNGYKLYDETGCQLVPALSDSVTGFIARVGDELAVQSLPGEKAGELIRTIGREIDEAYYKAVLDIQLDLEPDKSGLKIVFSPQHGTANVPVREVLTRLGYDLHVVEEQAFPDPDFRNTKSPNPENRAAFELAVEKAREISADIVITTDPDADRLGMAVLHRGNYAFLTGNQAGAVLLEYILSQRKAQGTLPSDGIVIDTIVTGGLGERIAEAYGMATERTLTGFKFIGDRIHAYEQNGEHTYVFGYEESYGYLISPIARDKDAIQAVLMACEAALFYKKRGRTLKDVLEGLFAAYGYYTEGQHAVELEGAAGKERIAQIMRELRENPPRELAGLAVSALEDYESGVRLSRGVRSELTLPKSDVLKFILEDGSWAAARPSGTEPKCKFYFCAQGKSPEEARAKLDGMTGFFKRFG
jgi:phosphoglucomutase